MQRTARVIERCTITTIAVCLTINRLKRTTGLLMLCWHVCSG